MIPGHILRALAELLHVVIHVYIFIIIIRSVISWMGNIPPNTFTYILRRLTDPVFIWVHRKLPFTVIGGIDISPIIIIVALYFIDNVLYGILMGYASQLLIGGR